MVMESDNMVTYWTNREHDIADLLKTMTMRKASKELDISYDSVKQTVFRMRNKVEKAQNTVNVANNWMKHKRLAKLLRRQKPITKENDLDE